MTSDKQLLSNTITNLRFPLIVGVVLIHSQFHVPQINDLTPIVNSDFHLFYTLQYLLSNILASVAVPLFFFFSGFLFFYNIPENKFNGAIYINKIRKRARTLLLPYILWNIFTILLKLLSEIFLPQFVDSQHSIMNYSISDWLWDFWDTGRGRYLGSGRGYPIDFPLWFIRDLMIIVICSPVAYCVVRWCRYYAVILLGIMSILGLKSGITGLNTGGFFFFTLGAYFSINGKNFVLILRPYMLTATIMYFALAALELYFRDATWVTDIHLHSITILVGMIVAINTTSYFIERGIWKVSTFLAAASFFVYVYHAMPQIFINKLSFNLLHPHSEASLLVLYVICPTLTILLGLALYWGLRKFFPRLTAVITGGR